MTEFQAALGLTQMNKLDRIITARRQHAVYMILYYLERVAKWRLN